jgi:hypothetical protein
MEGLSKYACRGGVVRRSPEARVYVDGKLCLDLAIYGSSFPRNHKNTPITARTIDRGSVASFFFAAICYWLMIGVGAILRKFRIYPITIIG